jgi:hypothetical protein
MSSVWTRRAAGLMRRIACIESTVARHWLSMATTERAIVPGVRVPEAIERAEASGLWRLVDGRSIARPRKALGDSARELRQAVGEARAEQARVARPAAVVDEADDRRDAEPAQRLKRRSGHDQSALAGPSGAVVSHSTG